jgi:polyhydroxybutyrate depolymerase
MRWAAFLSCFAACAGTSTSADDGGAGDARAADGGVDAGPELPSCEPGSRDGPAGNTDDERTPGDIDYNLRTPDGYDPTVAVPLIVVYSPAGVTDPAQTEAFTGLTPAATSRGYAIAYVNHVSPGIAADVDEVGLVPGLIAERWCIDESRVYLTGHSDGGSVATLLALGGITPVPAAIAPSAAGVNGGYLASRTCPADPVAVMVLHSANDGLFPGFGAETAPWWADCDGCEATPGEPLPDGCVAYPGCAAGLEVQYCEGTGSHGTWPPLYDSMIDFFDRFRR